MNASAPRPVLRASGRTVLLAVCFVLALAVLPGGSASAATAPVVQCSSILNQGGQAVACTVTVVNTLDVATGVGSSVVTVQQCTGPAGAAVCAPPVVSSFQDVVASVSQCNGAANGGGGTITCAVDVTNEVTGGATPTPATVNQCIGSADGGGTTICNPVGSTSGATVTQCNGSGNGGGSTVRCTVDPGTTESASLRVTVDQCNGSANGGGALVTCRASIINTVRAAPAPAPAPPSPTASMPAPTSSPSPTPAASATTTPPATPASSASPSPSASSAPPAATTPPAPPSAAPTAPVTPVTPVAGAPAAPVTPAAPVMGPATGVLPDVLAPEEVIPLLAPVPDAGLTGESLPTTGLDSGLPVLLGLTTTAAGGLLLLAGRRPRGRHVLR